jgi:hypothetical protein
MAIVRTLAVAAISGLLAFQVVRASVMALPFADRLLIAQRIWPDHPRQLIDQAMGEIGVAAASGRAVSEATMARVRSAAAKAPLSAEPFLIQGAIAQTEGRGSQAERLFQTARDRDPRSLAARYFLSELYFRTGRIPQGLIEMAALARIEPRAAAPFLPAVAAYARTPGAVPQLKRFFRTRTDVELDVLSLLSQDARNAELVLALATVDRTDPPPEWRKRIVQSLVHAGQFGKARAIWLRLNRLQDSPGLFNPRFEKLAATPPFNWTYSETSDGLAEPSGAGRLEVLYYGRQPAVLASQLLSLQPGRYRLGMEISGETQADGLQWSVRCANRNQKLIRLPLRGRAPNGAFAVPPNCPAQWIELQGTPGEMPRTVEVSVGGLRLAAAGAQ